MQYYDLMRLCIWLQDTQQHKSCTQLVMAFTHVLNDWQWIPRHSRGSEDVHTVSSGYREQYSVIVL